MPADTNLILVRHGETVWHAENRYAGISEVALTDQGRAQAVRLQDWAERRGIDAVWCSPLSRAQNTAAPAARALGVEPVVEKDLSEVDFGIAEGRTLDEVAADHPAEVAAFLRDPAAYPLPGGECPVAAAGRGGAVLAAIADRHPGETVLIVTHNTLIRLTLCRLLGIPLGRYRAVLPRLRNCAPTEIRMRAGEAALLSYNVPL